VYIQVTSLGGEDYISDTSKLFPFREVTDTIKGIATSVVDTLKEVKPRRASVEFGLEIGVESGKLTTLLVRGTGTANLKITLEWGDVNAG
jgi:Trypsin-co-occurring domain 1